MAIEYQITPNSSKISYIYCVTLIIYNPGHDIF